MAVAGLTLNYDAEATAAYLTLGPGPIVESEEVRPSVVLDFDANGRIVGIEVLSAREVLHPDLLAGVAA
jgi:uncharacterized protein YuzE